MMKSPDQPLHCLLVQPEFPLGSFWNYKAAVEIIGAKTPNSPLGLITVAAILPQHWTFRLVDCNCEELTEAAWDWADLVCIGGMLPQQRATLALVNEANRRGKFIVVGGPDPSSQPEIYAKADARVLGEGEASIPLWLESWRSGEPRGLFQAKERPDVTTTPVPRYDLLTIKNYGQLALQISRGCPFNCEFCDIIELFGRKPRVKTAAQVERELSAIRATGYSGGIDVVDDNFIGNKRYIRREILPALSRWNRRRLKPFYFVTEASMNLADDEPMMAEMVHAGFRIVFTGIETTDPELLMKTQKTQNTMRPIDERLRRMMAQGLMPTAGFIFGFDNEKPGMDVQLVKCIEDAPLVIAMIGMLVALPNTQLSRRLKREGRLLGVDGKLIIDDGQKQITDLSFALVETADQTVGGLNFVTTRDRVEILTEYRRAISQVYAPKAYFDRVRRMVAQVNFKGSRLPRPFEIKRNLLGLIKLCTTYTKAPHLRWLFWRNVFVAMRYGPNAVDIALQMAGMFLHFEKQRDRILEKTLPLMEPLPGDLNKTQSAG